MHHLTKGVYWATFEGETAKLQQTETHQVVMMAKHNHGLYLVQAAIILPKSNEQVHVAVDINVVHWRMAHMSIKHLKQMVSDGRLRNVTRLTCMPGGVQMIWSYFTSPQNEVMPDFKGPRVVELQILHSWTLDGDLLILPAMFPNFAPFHRMKPGEITIEQQFSKHQMLLQ